MKSLLTHKLNPAIVIAWFVFVSLLVSLPTLIMWDPSPLQYIYYPLLFIYGLFPFELDFSEGTHYILGYIHFSLGLYLISLFLFWFFQSYIFRLDLDRKKYCWFVFYTPIFYSLIALIIFHPFIVLPLMRFLYHQLF